MRNDKNVDYIIENNYNLLIYNLLSELFYLDYNDSIE